MVYVQAQEPEAEDVLSISYYGYLFLRHKWKMLAAVTLLTGIAAIYCSTLTPIYESTVRISIDPRISSAAVGKETDPMGTSDTDQIINTEMQIIQSDAVLRPVAEEYKLVSEGAESDKDEKSSKQRSATTKASTKALGDGAPLTEAPVSLKNLIVAHPPNSLLIDISYRSTNRQQAAQVANAIAQSYITLGMETRARSAMNLSAFMEKQIAQLKKNMQDSSMALAGYEHKLGVINPNEKTSMVAAHLLQLQSEYTEAQNDRIQKETEFRVLRPDVLNAGTGAAIEMSPQAGMLGQQQAQVRAAEEKLAVARTTYGVNYPEYKRAAKDLEEVTRQYEQMRSQASKRIQVAYQEALKRENMLQNLLTEGKRESAELDANYAQYEELKREADADKNLYEELFRKIKEAGVNAGFQGSSIRITNQARPARYAVFPRKGLFTLLAFLLSSFLSLIAVVLADMFDNTLRDPKQAQRLIGCDVIGTLPRVRSFLLSGDSLKQEERRARRIELPRIGLRANRNEAFFETGDFYQESIAILLSTIMHNRTGAPLRSLLITSPGPGDGKSSCAAHLALASANLGKRTLLIDGDLRRPFQHRFFDLRNEDGLGGSIIPSLSLKAIRKRVDTAGASLDVVVAGSASRSSFSQLGRRIEKLLQQASEEYDLVIVDAPPMIGLSDPVQIACATDSVLIIGHASRTSRQAIAEVVSTLHRVNANIMGVVLNQVRPELSPSYSRYAGYAAYAAHPAD